MKRSIEAVVSELCKKQRVVLDLPEVGCARVCVWESSKGDLEKVFVVFFLCR